MNSQQSVTCDLDEAASILRTALWKTQARNPARATLNYVLGTTMHMRYLRTQMLSDLEQLRTSFQESWDSENAAPTLRIGAAARAAEISVHQALKLNKALSAESDLEKAA
ncbi:hypothetical protein QBC40DRAFT_257749 [Triangularia verruculosa]|uniref:Uncharacterized protein n=1 Tax=Triangularia verruculosa TaxID=2587418 RepID=A0AAN7ARJ7_9PEZI|nr:hypothetical protein QBC40DRAFT_257749 [Triangularia verruculosa]